MVNQSILRRLVYGAATLATALWMLPVFSQDMGTAPSWAQSMTPGTWTTISQNTIADLDPAKDPAANPNYPGTAPWAGNNGQSCVIDCWNGGALATGYGAKGALIIWGGGHAGYYGNEVYAFDLATQQWSRLTNPYPNPVFPVTDGIWPDGTPSVPHTYGMVGYDPNTNSFATMLVQTSNNFYLTAIPMFFDLGTKKWRRAPQSPKNVVYGGWTAYDAKRDAWWMEGGDSGGVFARYSMNGDGTNGTWSNWPANFSSLDSMAAIDPDDDVLVVTDFGKGPNLYGIDLTNPSAAPVALTQGGSPPTRDGREGWEWSTLRHAFIYWRSGADVYEVKLTGGTWATGTWTWIKLTSSANTIAPTDPSPGVYNRFRLARYGTDEYGVVVNDINGPVYAFRLPTVIAPDPPTLNAAK